jgi:hypothetical protein
MEELCAELRSSHVNMTESNIHICPVLTHEAHVLSLRDRRARARQALGGFLTTSGRILAGKLVSDAARNCRAREQRCRVGRIAKPG